MSNKGFQELIESGQIEKLVVQKLPDIQSKVQAAVRNGQILPEDADDCVQDAALAALIAAARTQDLTQVDTRINQAITTDAHRSARNRLLVPLEKCCLTVSIPEDTIALKAATQQALDHLPPRHRKVVDMRYGIGSGGRYRQSGNDFDMTFKAIGEQLGGITDGRVKQIEARALRRLRHPSIIKTLKSFRP